MIMSHSLLGSKLKAESPLRKLARKLLSEGTSPKPSEPPTSVEDLRKKIAQSLKDHGGPEGIIGKLEDMNYEGPITNAAVIAFGQIDSEFRFFERSEGLSRKEVWEDPATAMIIYDAVQAMLGE